MKKATLTIVAVFLSAILTSCASQKMVKQGEADVKKPINCATAEGDIRALNSEKTHASQQLADGVMAIVPAALVVGVVTGTEGSKAKVATGDYNKMIDAKIAEIKTQCGM